MHQWYLAQPWYVVEKDLVLPHLGMKRPLLLKGCLILLSSWWGGMRQVGIGRRGERGNRDWYVKWKKNEKGKCNDIFKFKWDPENPKVTSAELCSACCSIDVSVKKLLDWRNSKTMILGVLEFCGGISFNVQEETWKRTHCFYRK